MLFADGLHASHLPLNVTFHPWLNILKCVIRSGRKLENHMCQVELHTHTEATDNHSDLLCIYSIT